MKTSTSLVCLATVMVAMVPQVNAHGYMYLPPAKFNGTVTSNWVVQIELQWSGDWDSCSRTTTTTVLLRSTKHSRRKKGCDNIRALLDSNTTLFGEHCGYTDPNATPKDPPTDGTATFSRGMVHAGPREIWLDDTLVLSNDDCQTPYGDGTQALKSVFKPMDYSSCSTSGCMLRFYWLAFQGLESNIVWQVYKNCVPLSGPVSGGDSSISTTNTTSSSSS